MLHKGNEKKQNYPNEKNKIVKGNDNHVRIMKPLKVNRNNLALAETCIIRFLLVRTK